MVEREIERGELLKKSFDFKKEGQMEAKKNVREKLFLFVIGWAIDN